MSKFGLSEEKVNAAIASLQTSEAGPGLRKEVKHKIARNKISFTAMESLGLIYAVLNVSASLLIQSYVHCLLDQDDVGNLVVKQWVNSNLEELLWKHTCESLSRERHIPLRGQSLEPSSEERIVSGDPRTNCELISETKLPKTRPLGTIGQEKLLSQGTQLVQGIEDENRYSEW